MQNQKIRIRKRNKTVQEKQQKMQYTEMWESIRNMVADAPDEQVQRLVKERWDGIAKPLDSMGRFETLIAQIGAVTGNPDVDICRKAVIVMCADNGIVAEGVSQSGQEVTALVAESMGRQQSSVCKMAHCVGADVIPVDIGINGEETIPGVLDRKVMRGTENFLLQPAMTEEQAVQAIKVGMELTASCKKQGYGLLATGEMGIGNTTTSTAMAAALLGMGSQELDAVVGRGAGLDDAGLTRKRQVIGKALDKYGFRPQETLRILSCVGGLDIAGLVGVFLGGAKEHLPVVIDGVISAVAALAAERLVPGVREYMLPSHKSRELVSQRILQELGLEPVLDASMALGEGTGAVMMFGLLDMAMAVYRTPTTFEDISVEQYQRF
jgi:nicotinate-nucleotide--dimethylbenzimidazole phosphoribosyltransferase